MCICGSLPDHDTCSHCAPPATPADNDWDDPPPNTPSPIHSYDDEEPF
ncbi:hypothetical protein [Streptomyces acidiscabies]|nr:hypothetical protein [Streptomyces acidiscabies]